MQSGFAWTTQHGLPKSLLLRSSNNIRICLSSKGHVAAATPIHVRSVDFPWRIRNGIKTQPARRKFPHESDKRNKLYSIASEIQLPMIASYMAVLIIQMKAKALLMDAFYEA